MITKFKIENFKSYRNATLPLSPLTLLIGANASGKSNVLEAIRFLAWLARGRRLDDIFASVSENELSIRGALPDLAFARTNTITLGCILDNGSYNELVITITINHSGMRIIDEKIIASDAPDIVPLYEVKKVADQFSHGLSVAYNNFAQGGIKPQIACSDSQAIFTQLQTPARFNGAAAQKKIPELTSKFASNLSQIMFLDPIPARMRGYGFITDKKLQSFGGNLSSVLYDLCENRGAAATLMGFIKQLPEQDIRNIAFLKTPRSEVMVQLGETFANKNEIRDASVLSDGTLRVLAIAAALLSSPENSLVVIEEIDNGVHPSRAGNLLENIEKVAKARKLRVLLTSHNPALLDNLPLDAIPNVVYCYRDPKAGDSRLVRLDDLSDFPELIAQGTIGHLMTKGIIERFIKNPKTPEEKKDAALKWVEDLRKAGAV